VDGPTWIPLTDFGPTNAINVGSLALYPHPNGDPQLTTILVGTGSEDANRIQRQEMLGTEDLRFDGVGFLMSEDAGKTWQVLDSLNNFDTTTGTYRAISDTARDHLFVGTVVKKPDDRLRGGRAGHGHDGQRRRPVPVAGRRPLVAADLHPAGQHGAGRLRPGRGQCRGEQR
jgi:hypothetical protein